MMTSYSKRSTVAGFVMASFCVGGVAQAGEGAGSHYVPGTRNDFLLGVFGPAGWYVRNDLWYFDYSMGVNPRGGVVTGEATEKAWLNTLKLSYLSNKEFFGARYGASMAATYVINADISGAATIGGGNALTGGDVSGLSDLYVAPVLLNWTGEKQHFTFQGAFYAPTGGYNPNAKLNTGRNYWTLDFVGNYTWFDPATGWEVSANAGYQYNFENPETNYKTGDETHVDWTFAKHFANKTALGLSGYYYAQVESDSGTLVGPKNASDFQAYSWGLGPSAQFNLPVGDKSVGIIAKALFDIDSKDRLEGDLFMLSATYAF